MGLDELVQRGEMSWASLLYSVRRSNSPSTSPGKSFVGAGVAWICSGFKSITSAQLSANQGTLGAPAVHPTTGVVSDLPARRAFDEQATVLSVTLDNVPSDFDWSKLSGSPWTEVRELRIVNSPDLKEIPSTAFDNMPWLTAFYCKKTGITNLFAGTFKRNKVLSGIVINDNEQLTSIEEGFLSVDANYNGEFAWPRGMHLHTSRGNQFLNELNKLMLTPGAELPTRTPWDAIESPLETLAVLDLQRNALNNQGLPSRTLYKLAFIHVLDLGGNQHTALPFGLRDALVPRPGSDVPAGGVDITRVPHEPSLPWRAVYIYPGVNSIPSGACVARCVPSFPALCSL
jgi:hypothetical protein